ncbi:MAG: bacteriohemerythrin [Acidobacteriia bacterium]|nr:bacteriohemerythrin [Terriglobia bacterium]
MSLFAWNEAYSVGNVTIDAQHKMLFQYADKLHAAMSAGNGKDTLNQTLSDLIAYTKKHFAAEENLMQTHHYPEYPQHKAEHDALTEKVVRFQNDYLAGRVALTGELLRFLKDWLSHHIGEIDKKVGKHLQLQAH